MTFQPPPPPPGSTPPPPPPGSTPPPPPGAGGFDPKTVNNLDWAIAGAGALAFIFSFISYYSVSVSSGGYEISETYSAWHGFFGWFAALLAVVGSAATLLPTVAPSVSLPLAGRVLGVVAYLVAALCVILAIFVIPDGGAGDIPGVDSGHGFGFWVSLIVILAGAVLSIMRAQQTNTALPGPLNNIPKIGS